MKQAYAEGKDLYCVIASKVFNNEYWENLENFPEGYVVELDGKKTVAGSEKSFEKHVTDKLEVPYYYLVPTEHGDIAAVDIKPSDKVVASEGSFEVLNVKTEEEITTIYFTD